MEVEVPPLDHLLPLPQAERIDILENRVQGLIDFARAIYYSATGGSSGGGTGDGGGRGRRVPAPPADIPVRGRGSLDNSSFL